MRRHAKHMWGELVQHSRTEGMLKQHLAGAELREVQKKLVDVLR